MTLNLPLDRRVTADDIKARLAAAAQEGVGRGELEVLESDAVNFLKGELRAMKTEFAKANRNYDAEMLVRDACTAVSRTEGLWRAEPSTLLGATMTAAQLGLRIGVLGHSWLLPFWSSSNGRMEAQLIIGYQGYVDLCYGSGLVVDIASEVVYQKEANAGKFRFHRNEDRPRLYHEPDMSIASRDSCPQCHEINPKCPNVARHGELIHAFYATARTKGGGFNVTRPWGLAMMLAHRDRYAKKGHNGVIQGPWRDEFPAMAQKTMARILTRLLPKTEKVSHALAADEGVRYTFSPSVQPGDATEHETQNLVFDADEVAAEAETHTMHPADRM